MRLIDIYSKAKRIRMIEEAIARNYHADGKPQVMRCPVHLSIGQELLAVAFCEFLMTTDTLFSTHRCHAHYLAKGGDLRAMLSELCGRVDGCIGGRGGSMHLTDKKVGMVASIPIVASAIPLAVGSALSFDIDNAQNVASVIFGDACLEEGVTHESMNFASLRKLPVIFVCENNLYSVYTKLKDRQPARDLTEIGRAHGIMSYRCDGNDVDALLDTFGAATGAVRSGNGPAFVVVDTYRWLEHCGPNYDNHLGYRTEEEFMQWRAKDGLEALEKQLLSKGQVMDSQVSKFIKEFSDEIEEAFNFAYKSPYPSPELASEFVYA